MKMKNMIDELLQEQIEELREQLAELQAKHMPPMRPIGTYEFIFDHPNGDELLCYLEIDEGDLSEPPRATLVNAYLGGVDVQGLLPVKMIDRIESEALYDPN
jgi:hypothetical protein